jgi:hypothetical protein
MTKKKGRSTSDSMKKVRAEHAELAQLANDLRTAFLMASETMPPATARRVSNFLALRPYGDGVALDYIAFG